VLRNLCGFFGAVVWEQVYFRVGSDPIWRLNAKSPSTQGLHSFPRNQPFPPFLQLCLHPPF
jgi:hypothetical protein